MVEGDDAPIRLGRSLPCLGIRFRVSYAGYLLLERRRVTDWGGGKYEHNLNHPEVAVFNVHNHAERHGRECLLDGWNPKQQRRAAGADAATGCRG